MKMTNQDLVTRFCWCIPRLYITLLIYCETLRNTNTSDFSKIRCLRYLCYSTQWNLFFSNRNHLQRSQVWMTSPEVISTSQRHYSNPQMKLAWLVLTNLTLICLQHSDSHLFRMFLLMSNRACYVAFFRKTQSCSSMLRVWAEFFHCTICSDTITKASRCFFSAHKT